MQPKTEQPFTKKLAIFALILIGIIFIIWTTRYVTSRNQDGIYTDPNNGNQIAENYDAEPEDNLGEEYLIMTGKDSLVQQGLDSTAINAITTIFTEYNKDIKLVSVISKTIEQTRQNYGDAFTYNFQVQIDKKDKLMVSIVTADITSGTVYIKSLDGSKILKQIKYPVIVEDEEEEFDE